MVLGLWLVFDVFLTEEIDATLSTLLRLQTILVPSYKSLLFMSASRSADKVVGSAGEGEATLYKCVPEHWLYLPKTVRKGLAWVTISLFSFSFFSPILGFPLLVPALWRRYPWMQCSIIASLVGSMLLPPREWIWFRKIGQLWYEVFDFHCNLSSAEIEKVLIHSDDHQLILAMHPHGIVPFQAILWAAYCDQYFTLGKRMLYGFGAAADAVNYVPFLRNIMGFLSAGSASYKPLKDGLMHVSFLTTHLSLSSWHIFLS